MNKADEYLIVIHPFEDKLPADVITEVGDVKRILDSVEFAPCVARVLGASPCETGAQGE